MDPFGWKSMTVAGSVCTIMATRAVKKKSLTVSGAFAGVVVGFVIISCGLRGLTLFWFYLTGTWATKYRLALKIKYDATLQSHTSRGVSQVLCVSAIACALAVWHAVVFGAEHPFRMTDQPAATRISCALVAHHSTSLADTWASELGILSDHRPFLVTQPWRKVPPGTNGGVTMAGLVFSLLGGTAVGLFTVLMDYISGLEPDVYCINLIAFATVSGLLGSVIDSLVGATMQATYWDSEKKLVYHADSIKPRSAQIICGANILTNEQVNLVSTAITIWIGGWIIAPMMFE